MELDTWNFPKNLLAARKKRGFTQKKLAGLANLSPQWISHFENGERDPSLINFCRLCNALNLPPQNLLMP